MRVSHPTRQQARGHLLQGLVGDLPVGDDDENGLADRAPRQVVKQPQRRLVGLMHVVDDEEEPPARCCEAHQLGGGDEEPLVAGLAGPWHVLTGERSLELGPELVGEPVEQALGAAGTGH